MNSTKIYTTKRTIGYMVNQTFPSQGEGGNRLGQTVFISDIYFDIFYSQYKSTNYCLVHLFDNHVALKYTDIRTNHIPLNADV